MKKIMFNDNYGLTKAVLEGRKTMTRRLMNPQPHWWRVGGVPHSSDMQPILPAYKVGEVVAVAQSYLDCYNSEGSYELQYALSYLIMECDKKAFADKSPESAAGWTNKMFVRADLMPHQIRITDIDTQLLHDISDEDCLREGIMRKWIEAGSLYHYYLPGVPVKSKHDVYSSPCDAFAALIDKTCGKGTWYRNPWVFVYQFELVK